MGVVKNILPRYRCCFCDIAKYQFSCCEPHAHNMASSNTTSTADANQPQVTYAQQPLDNTSNHVQSVWTVPPVLFQRWLLEREWQQRGLAALSEPIPSTTMATTALSEPIPSTSMVTTALPESTATTTAHHVTDLLAVEMQPIDLSLTSSEDKEEQQNRAEIQPSSDSDDGDADGNNEFDINEFNRPCHHQRR